MKLFKKDKSQIATMLIVLLALLAASCNDEPLPDKRPEQETRLETPSSNSSGSGQSVEEVKRTLSLQLARLVALSMANPQVRQLIKTEVIHKRDGDYNVLFERIKNRQLRLPNRTVTFAEFLAHKGDMTDQQLAEFLESMENVFPLAQIAVPELPGKKPEDWPVGQHIPDVAVFYPEASNSSESMTAFNALGDEFQVDAVAAPERLTAVISENERLLVTEKTGFPSVLSDISRFLVMDNYLLWEKVYTAPRLGDDFVQGNGGIGDVNCDGKDGDRLTNNDKDNFNKFKFASAADAQNAEPWAAGGFEIKVVIVMANENPDDFSKIVKFITANRGDIINCNVWGNNCSLFWKNVDAEVVTWEPADIGEEMHYEIIETDSGNDIEISITPTLKIFGIGVEGTVKTTIPINHDRLGSSIVEYCDNTDGQGTRYNTGSVKFYVNQQ